MLRGRTATEGLFDSPALANVVRQAVSVAVIFEFAMVSVKYPLRTHGRTQRDEGALRCPGIDHERRRWHAFHARWRHQDTR